MSGLLYYLNRVFTETPRRVIHVVVQPPDRPLKIEKPGSVPLVILAADTGAENTRILGEYMRGGGTVLYVATEGGASGRWPALARVPSASLKESSPRRSDAGRN